MVHDTSLPCSRRVRANALTIALLLVACGAPNLDPNDVRAAEEGTHVTPGQPIRPKVGRQMFGQPPATTGLVVTLPACPPSGPCPRSLYFTPSIAIDGVPTALAEIRAVSAGRHVITLQNPTNDVTGSRIQSLPVDVVQGQVRTVVLAAAMRWCTPVGDDVAPKLSFGRQPKVDHLACPTAFPQPAKIAKTVVLQHGTQTTTLNSCTMSAPWCNLHDPACQVYDSAWIDGQPAFVQGTSAAPTERIATVQFSTACRLFGAAVQGPAIFLRTTDKTANYVVAAIGPDADCLALADNQERGIHGTTNAVGVHHVAIEGYPAEPPGYFIATCERAKTLHSRSKMVPWTESWIALLPDTVTLTNEATTITRTLAEGEIVRWDLEQPPGSPPPSFRTTVIAPVRALPTATGAPRTEIVAPPNCGPGYDLTTTSGEIALDAYRDPGCAFALSVGGKTTPLDPDGSTLRIGRLDVDHAIVTHSDGSTSAVPGTYDVRRLGVHLLGPYPTGTGIDLPPGSYQLDVTYAADGGPKTDVLTVAVE